MTSPTPQRATDSAQLSHGLSLLDDAVALEDKVLGILDELLAANRVLPTPVDAQALNDRAEWLKARMFATRKQFKEWRTELKVAIQAADDTEAQ